MESSQPGVFVKSFDWSAAQFAPYKLDFAKLNRRQRLALLNRRIDDECSELTAAQQVELCRLVPCNVELFHSNVCKGVEKAWPKRIFKKPFEHLTEEEQQRINRHMEKKGVLLYDKHVNEQRLAKRCRRRTNRTLARYREQCYRENLFHRITILADDDQSDTDYEDESEDESEKENVQPPPSNEDDTTELPAQSPIMSAETVIDTRKPRSKRPAVVEIDSSDSDNVSENMKKRKTTWEATNEKSKTTYHITTNHFNDLTDSDFEARTEKEYNYNFGVDDSSSAGAAENNDLDFF